MVALATATYAAGCTQEARLLRSNIDGMTNGPNMELHDRIVAVLDTLAYVSTKESSSVFATGLKNKSITTSGSKKRSDSLRGPSQTPYHCQK